MAQERDAVDTAHDDPGVRRAALQEPLAEIAPPGDSRVEAVPRAPQQASPRSWPVERRLLSKILRTAGNPPVTVELWDGFSVAGDQSEDGPRVRICDRATLWKLLVRPDFEFAEAYVAGRIEIDCDLTEATNVLFTAWKRRPVRASRERLRSWLRLRSRSISFARRNVEHHYDLGNDFYRLWLDKRLLYTCAYFESHDATLEAAQIAKMDHICRKVGLRSGDRVIEAGCGWGGLALFMAEHYGARVTAYNVSREQIRYAREKASEAGLSDRVTFVEADWREISGECDVFVSVGMLEHLGPENYRTLGDVIDGCLTPEGRGLIHSIGLNQPRPLDSWTERRIFPGAQPPTLRQAMKIFEPHDLSVLDVENLRLHYALTLRHWLRRFEKSAAVVRNMFDEPFVRMWRLYLACSVSAFETGCMQLFQIAFARGDCNDIPLTRSHLYDGRPRPCEDGLL